MSIADGHGSRVCFRSHIGAKMAVEIMNRLVEQGYHLIEKKQDDQAFGANIATEFMRLWTMYIKKHLREHPFKDSEVHDLDATKRRILGKNAFVAYGSTLLSVLTHKDKIYSWQLGDGDILQVNQNGKVEFLIPKDKRFIGNETTSTCSPNAQKEFKFEVHKIPEEQTHFMVLMASDGYSNSFRTQRGFKQAGSDFFSMIHEEGLEIVDQNLKEWLNETSQLGSGDDISVGIMYCEKNEGRF